MKIFIKCESPLLQKTLEIYLKEHICEQKNADFFIGDMRKYFEKPLFLISKNSPYLTIPFTQKDLICALEEYSFILKNTGKKISKEEKISNLIDNFKANLLQILKENDE